MTSLKSLSDKELLARMAGLRRREHKTTLEILFHLNEIERRRLHLKLGCGSLYEYCTRHLKYSASAACRRIHTARCVRMYPEVHELLEQEKVNLSTVSLVAPILTDKNKLEILDAICDKSQREVESIASRYRPPVALRDMVKPVRVHVSDRTGSTIGLPLEHSGSRAEVSPNHSAVANKTSCEPSATSGQTDSAMSIHHRCGGQELSTRAPNHIGLLGSYEFGMQDITHKAGTRTEQKLLIQFLADEAFMKKYEEAHSLLSQRLPDTSFASVFDALISEFLERRSPEKKKARRDMRKKQKSPLPAKPRQAAAGRVSLHPRHAVHEHNTTSPSNTRHIPASVRDEVFARDKGRCVYVGTTGERCESTQALQIDHIVPFARGGATIASNLRLLCAKHNRIAAEEVFGEAISRRYVARDSVQHRRE